MSFKLHYRPETEIFVNDQLTVTIRQKNFEMQDEALVVLAPEDIPAIIEALQTCASEALEMRTEEENAKAQG